MSIALKNLSDFVDWDFDDIIDVRSPSEFAEDHIPGAVNMPALSDEQRAEVGTIYVQESRFKARRIGAAHVARNAADHIERYMGDKDGSWRPLVHCWRGGQRSGSFGSILAQIGWRVEVLEGGYQTYRRLVVKALYDTVVPHKLILIDGHTGTAKTEILTCLREAGAQVLDLEGLAAHRGSLFGATAQRQPTQKLFEGQLAVKLAGLDPNLPVFVEAESNRIGQIKLPPSLWQAMIYAPRITVAAPLTARANYLVQTYGDVVTDEAEILSRIKALSPYQSKEQIAKWAENARVRDYFSLATSLMQDHYDPRYSKAQHRYERIELGRVDLADLDSETLKQVAVPMVMSLAHGK